MHWLEIRLLLLDADRNTVEVKITLSTFMLPFFSPIHVRIIFETINRSAGGIPIEPPGFRELLQPKHEYVRWGRIPSR